MTASSQTGEVWTEMYRTGVLLLLVNLTLFAYGAPMDRLVATVGVLLAVVGVIGPVAGRLRTTFRQPSGGEAE